VADDGGQRVAEADHGPVTGAKDGSVAVVEPTVAVPAPTATVVEATLPAVLVTVRV